MNKMFYYLLLLLISFIPLSYAQQTSVTLYQENATLPTEGEIVAENLFIYRKFVSVTPEGTYRLQNFYKNNDKKQSNAFVITDIRNIGSFQNLETITMKDLIFEGKLVIWFDNGNKSLEFFIQDGKAEGLSTSWYKNSTKKEQGTFKVGNKEGLWKIWDDEGNMLKKQYYLRSQLQWEKEVFSLKNL